MQRMYYSGSISPPYCPRVTDLIDFCNMRTPTGLFPPVVPVCVRRCRERFCDTVLYRPACQRVPYAADVGTGSHAVRLLCSYRGSPALRLPCL